MDLKTVSKDADKTDNQSKAQSQAFDPNSLASKDSNIFGLPFDAASAQQVLIPVPWEVTVSYNAGTASGPEAIFEASKQVDLFDPDVKDAWRLGLAMLDVPQSLIALNATMRVKAEEYISGLEDGRDAESDEIMAALLKEINQSCDVMNSWVYDQALELINAGKLVGLIGGDHSTPLGLMRALATKYSEYGILHFDAHADLRDAYEGFKYSHASIMFNALSIDSLKKLVQVGIRDFCEQEHDLVRHSKGRIVSYYDRDIKSRLYSGENWREICNTIVHQLPQNVYVSFDVDGLDPKLCPNTGTPVPGGLELEQAIYLVKQLVEQGKTIIGFDVNEVAPGDDEWDANVGARLVYRLANLAALSRGLEPVLQ
ncbi:MAG: agmatinase [Cyanobacteriota bacterium erpe_2018_sw_39hr_WHONDRS-SW48-000098_B_bin.30]|jgi:agmatinase|nr:agmatinase [Cyanobacteriota bacterium erpe_2018_sw_39hr_WHONDRS-SW48-000098_B_bin.30]